MVRVIRMPHPTIAFENRLNGEKRQESRLALGIFQNQKKEETTKAGSCVEGNYSAMRLTVRDSSHTNPSHPTVGGVISRLS
jgi:hypothetical protein